ncbi:DUF4260 domain-containing protein [Pelagibacterium sp. 26DY04]|uniref:DUF4260 domain-containing protein n=1 Tax=Pelagibacterium sp. 26DY04 TaxID=2967130 RepID=UPI0028163C12|nr:DUF4260 domain-containing protein [Pelagibacterium sp. 26DY04]WMT87568.1 DUF4260 domain-containing protein [Pelagibacterium sp. 26DY04]
MNDAPNPISPSEGAATGGVRLMLRLEGLAVLAAATSVYFLAGGNPWLFAIVFFMPDLSFLAYVINARVGAAAYNAVHTYILPLALAGAGWSLEIEPLWQIALIVAAHAGFDRSLGYGLKYASAFSHTHLGAIGRKAE